MGRILASLPSLIFLLTFQMVTGGPVFSMNHLDRQVQANYKNKVEVEDTKAEMSPISTNGANRERQETGLEVGENVGQIISGVLGGGVGNIFGGSANFIGNQAAQEEVTFVLNNVAPALDVVLKYGFQGIQQYFKLGTYSTTVPPTLITKEQLVQQQIAENNKTINALQQILTLQKLQEQHKQNQNQMFPSHIQGTGNGNFASIDMPDEEPSPISQTMQTIQELKLLQKLQLQNFEHLQQQKLTAPSTSVTASASGNGLNNNNGETQKIVASVGGVDLHPEDPDNDPDRAHVVRITLSEEEKDDNSNDKRLHPVLGWSKLI